MMVAEFELLYNKIPSRQSVFDNFSDFLIFSSITNLSFNVKIDVINFFYSNNIINSDDLLSVER